MRRKSYNIAGHVHYLTFSCYRRQQLLTDNRLRLWLAQIIDKAREAEEFNLYAYVIMPEHVHLLVHPRNLDYSMAKILRRIKEPFTHRVVPYWKKDCPEKLARLRTTFGRRVVHRFWQPGGGYDRNLYNLAAVCRVIEYIEFNPVRRGLVSEPKDWLWSSAQAREGKAGVHLQIDEVCTERCNTLEKT